MMTAPSPSSSLANGAAPGAGLPPSRLTAEACDRIVQAIRGKAEETIAQLQQDVFRLIDQAGPDPDPHPDPRAGGGGNTAALPLYSGADPLLGDQSGAIRRAVRQEIERLDLTELIAAEVRRQMQNFAEQLQERMQKKQPSAMKKSAAFPPRPRR